MSADGVENCGVFVQARNKPLPLMLVIGFFLAIGVLGIAKTITYAIQGELIFDPFVIGIPVGRGLSRLKPGWHVCAVGLAALASLGVLYLFVMIAFGGAAWLLANIPPNVLPYFYITACVILALGVAMLWSIRILMMPSIRNRFSDPNFDRVASTIPPVIIILTLLCVSRLSGGIGGSISYTMGSNSSFENTRGVSLADIGAVLPLIIEFQADNEPSYLVTVWNSTRKSEKHGMSTSYTQEYIRYSGILVPDDVRKARNRIVVRMLDLKLSGTYWMPIVKTGTAACKVPITGLGRYQSFEAGFELKYDFQRVGLSTTKRLVDDVRKYVESQAYKAVLKSALQSNGLVSLERNDRGFIPLAPFEKKKLAEAYQLLGRNYTRNGMYGDAADVYQRAIFAFECLAYPNNSNDWSDSQHSESARKSLMEIYCERGNMKAVKQDTEGAIEDYTEAIRLNPEYSIAYYYRGTIKNMQEEYGEAIDDFEEAIRLNPTYALALNSIARLHSTCPDDRYRNGLAAVEFAKRACEISGWKNGEHLDTLAAAHAECGDFKTAANWQRKAIEIAANHRGDVSVYQKQLDFYLRQTQPRE